MGKGCRVMDIQPFGPMRVTFQTGAVLLIDDVVQLSAMPEDMVVQPTGETDADGRRVYRELPSRPDLAAQAMAVAALKAASAALTDAAEGFKGISFPRSPIFAQRARQAALAADDVIRAIAGDA